ncbi:MAG: sulfatase [Bacteroidetes bacterium]|nr:sulfatase [Bacteroidota bacterium]MBT4400518.1 sulfatase [Bacteroidota bacterium]MBT4412257.1 sulfatase [Bacteroidota bacterium]MBT7094202.1 sulfatase [Bacteroidota bacterium]MBT7465220.1 sulfatase [Bacteroidota bacterium]
MVIVGILLLGSCTNKSTPPNLLFVFPDQMRASTLGFMEKEPVMTPHLDRFASEGLVLTNAVSNAPVCSPYRAMMMSGRYPISNGVVSNTTSKLAPLDIQLRKDEVCWSDILKENGYSLGYIGKWHLDYPHEPYIDCANNRGETKWNEWCPPERRHGFDFWYSYDTYDYHMKPLYWSTDAKREEFHYVDQWGPEHEADMALNYLANENGEYRDNDKPFALVVSMNPPHMPYNQLPDKYVRMYDDMDEQIQELINSPSVPDTSDRWGKYYRKHIKNQLAMVTGVDEQFGRILQGLKDFGYEKNTIVVFTSDHGDNLGKHGKISKTNPYEESFNIPFIIRWPDKIKPRHDSKLLLSVPDLYPSLLDLMGFSKEIPDAVEGSSFANYFTGGDAELPTSQLYFIVRHNNLLNPEFGSLKQKLSFDERGIRTEQYTLMIDRKANGPTDIYLWDRKADPYQMNNLAKEKPELVEKLYKKELLPWLIKTGDEWRWERK